jgi:Carboxypeptidase regulatory-like domain
MRLFRFASSVLSLSFVAFAAMGVWMNQPLVSAQGIITGGITGSVTDPTGAVVPNASIQVKNQTTGAIFQEQSNAQGDFRIADLPLGVYSVTLSATGFSEETLNDVHVVAGNQTPLKISLQLGKTAQTVEVEGSASELINTVSAQDETSITTEQLATAPITGALDDVTLMVPGVVNTHTFMSNTNGVSYSVNGERGRSNNSEIDGQTNNDTSIGGPSFFFDNQDAVQEVQVVTAAEGAQYGRNMGAITNYITKNGTNDFHGSASEIYTGSWLSSLMQYQMPYYTGCTQAPGSSCLPKFVQNNWGGTLGGPILKNKLWFFGSTLWSHTYEGAYTVTSGGELFPDTTGLATLKSTFPGNNAVAAMAANGPQWGTSATSSKPLGVSAQTCTSAGGTPVNPGGTGPCTIAVTDGNSMANVEFNGYENIIPNYIDDQEHLGRIDYQMTTKDRFYLRYNYQNNPYSAALYLVTGAQAAGGGYPGVVGVTHEVGGDWTHSFTTNLLNQLRYAFQQANIGFFGGAIANCTIANFSPCTTQVNMGSGFSTYGYGTTTPQGRFVKVNQIQDNATWTRGRHTIAFGTEVDYQNSPYTLLPFAEGGFNFTPGVATYATGPNIGQTIPLRYPTGTTSAQQAALTNGPTGMLEGVGEATLAVGNPTIPFKETDFDFYFQDDWKIMHNLTLNLGLRYEFWGQAMNFLHNESVAQQTGPNPYWNTSLPLSATTTPEVASDYKNIEPRIGFAFTPDSAPRMVVHGGFYMNADPEFYSLFLNMATTAPVVNAGSFGCDGVTIQCIPSNGLTYSTVQAADKQFLPTGGDPRANGITTVPNNFHNPMGETWTLGIQYQVAPAAAVTVAYVGNHTFGNFQAINSNPDIGDVQTAFPSYGSGNSVCTTVTNGNPAPGFNRPNCNYSYILQYGNTAFSIYNALQFQLTTRNFHGFTTSASYTYSREISNADEFAGTGLTASGEGAFAQNPLNTDLGERGVSIYSYPSIWGIQMTYAEPWFNEQHGIIGRLLGGYTINSFYQFNGGQPFSPLQFSPTVTSNAVGADITANTNINATEAENSFCDEGFTTWGFGGAACRPILSNPKAPLSSVGINLGPGGYVDYITGNAVSPSSEHWLWNNQYQAIAANNPFPGVGRDTLRGDSFNSLDLSMSKDIRAAERVTVHLQVSAFNLFNRAFYNIPDPNLDSPYGLGDFLSNANTGTQESVAGGGAFPQGLGNRNIQLLGKIIF